ncbi:hypothetical protein [Paenibacillus sp. Y412MC10]|uniref:hypothetical protein n=1 Tax=Geobacillus sp. (strain Y412MC10) TaxID=481743 RepID=UPI0016430E16|nr:hypothetical protein [Paenibacillus sp. Y412MC10]
MAARKSINTTLDGELYTKLQFIALQLSAERGQKINVNDLLEEGMRYIISKYETPKG